jgi:hypothetical protein
MNYDKVSKCIVCGEVATNGWKGSPIHCKHCAGELLIGRRRAGGPANPLHSEGTGNPTKTSHDEEDGFEGPREPQPVGVPAESIACANDYQGFGRYLVGGAK